MSNITQLKICLTYCTKHLSQESVKEGQPAVMCLTFLPSVTEDLVTPERVEETALVSISMTSEYIMK